MSLALIFAATTLAVPLECGLHPKARELARLIIEDPEQKRRSLKCDGILAVVAQEKAREMAERGHVSHFGGGGANARVANAGYPLDRRYEVGLGNQIEAVAGGFGEAYDMWEAFKGSVGHRTHLLGEHPLYHEQDEISVGYYYDWNTPYVDYWVVYVARKDDSSPEPIVLIRKSGSFSVELE
ncbi:CAP domain-containing protein [Ferrimonas balearica]|uniref:CAP domain-containing protein n=1 Tax=Ferrimonas balearica TaxID=44012 RepID=UPI001C9930BE|nr:CAP domain-containing protein [Ferrimonas balearica]MBY5920311.1 CAP domain-containing protein [Ferrimonas balearica]MBY5997004.1 CAP domain-containing protein [Ferrimonas balearica]